VRIAGWLLVGVLAVALAHAGSAGAVDRTKVPAVDVYVEEFPTASGSVPADPGSLAAAGVSQRARATGSGGLIGLGLVLAGVAAGAVIWRLREPGRRS
jgi:hypothetical protein